MNFVGYVLRKKSGSELIVTENKNKAFTFVWS